MADFKLKVSKFLYISGSIGRLEFPLRMVLRRFLRILPISTHFHVNIHILLDVLLCRVFLRVVPYFGDPVGRVKIQTTSKNSQRYYTTKRLIRDLLSNTPNCYVRAGEFRGYRIGAGNPAN